MKKTVAFFAVFILFLDLFSCKTAQSEGQDAQTSYSSTWQEQYDLGVRYLSEGNYQEAIIAFTAAIEIDPKQAPAYVGRGDTYVQSGETESNLAAAKTDYEKAIELDEANAEAYLGLADVYIRQGDYEEALKILEEALEKVSNRQNIVDAIAKLDVKGIYGQTNFSHRSNYFDFGVMSITQKEAIEMAAAAAMNHNAEQLYSLCDVTYGSGSLPFEKEIYTIWNEYKIKFDLRDKVLEIEVRPENGVGYYAHIEPWYRTSYDNYEYEIDFGSCPCVNWQWNGAVTIQVFAAATSAELSPWGETTGTMKGSLREGIFTSRYSFYANSADSFYQNGIKVEYLGMKYEYPTVGGLAYDYAGAKDDWIDTLYW